jgi:hypothetical protein
MGGQTPQDNRTLFAPTGRAVKREELPGLQARAEALRAECRQLRDATQRMLERAERIFREIVGESD